MKTEKQAITGRKIRASEIVRGIDEGLTDSELMVKHRLNSRELAKVLEQLTQARKIGRRQPPTIA